MSRPKTQHSFSSSGPGPLQLSFGICAAIFVLCAVAQAQGDQKHLTRHLTDQPGTWKLENMLRQPQAALGFDLTAAQQKLWEAKMDTLVSILRPTPVFNPPIGVCVDALVRYAGFNCRYHNCKVDPAEAELRLTFLDIVTASDGRQVTDVAISTEAVVRLNTLDGAGGGNLLQGATMPDGRRIYFIPQEAQRVGALTLYWDSCGPHLTIAKPGRHVWVPVSCEEFISALIREQERPAEKQAESVAQFERAHAQRVAQRAEERKKILASGDKDAMERLKKMEAAWEKADAEGAARFAGQLKASSGGEGYKVIVESLRAELASMSPAERASPAWFNRQATKSKYSNLVPPNTPGSLQLVTANPEYFDRSLPRTEIQLISVSLCTPMVVDWRDVMSGDSSPTKSPLASPRRAYVFLTTADWKRVTQLIQ